MGPKLDPMGVSIVRDGCHRQSQAFTTFGTDGPLQPVALETGLIHWSGKPIDGPKCAKCEVVT